MDEISHNESLSKKDKLRRQLLIGGTIVFILVAIGFYLLGGRYVSTDDAYVQAARVDISANISGRVIKVDVNDNQIVHRGDLLFELDPREYQIAVENAKARLAEARMQVAALKASYRQRQADLKSARETLAYQQREFGRQERLASRNISSRAQLDNARHVFDEAKQKVNSVEQDQMNLLALLGGDPRINIDEHPSVLQARSVLDRAQLDLSYTVIRAPMDGVVAKVDGLQPGDHIKASNPVFSLVASERVWVEANFKETDLAHMRPGQPATIEIDAYPGRTFHGKLESLSPGTGSSFSLLPPENATGNWVKVVQRLPVRISLKDTDAIWPMHAGLSAIARVDTEPDSGNWYSFLAAPFQSHSRQRNRGTIISANTEQ